MKQITKSCPAKFTQHISHTTREFVVDLLSNYVMLINLGVERILQNFDYFFRTACKRIQFSGLCQRVCRWLSGVVDLQVMLMIAVTWLVPAGVFFTSIIGWQYFVGKRTVPPGRCYVQYMDNALFNLILQVPITHEALFTV